MHASLLFSYGMCLVYSILALNGLPKLFFFLHTVANFEKFPLIKLLSSNPSLIPNFEYAEVTDLEEGLKIHDVDVSFTLLNLVAFKKIQYYITLIVLRH